MRPVLRLAFVAAGLAFVVRAVLQGIDDGSFGDLDAGWLAAAFLSAAAGMTTIAARWSLAARLVGGDLPVGTAVPLYFQGEIGKYIPGSVWAVLGRGELARRAGLSRSAAYASVVSSLAALYLGAALTATMLLPFAAGASGTSAVLAVLAFLVIGLVGLHPAVVGKAVAVVERLSRRSLDVAIPSWRDAVWMVAGYVPTWVLIGGAHAAAARALGTPVAYPQMVFAASVSWSAGFLAIPAPGGIGVRESVFVLVSGLASAPAAAAALLARLLFVVVDGLGALLGSLWMTRRSGD
ncbi:MAG: lysylphosphatidylglycerol synthase domain-containing protein [Acidimicrobiales bacterium]|nr:lysylphosphatidylglycerol synthase domain-containing protein [Acidimicrobiales bacterium]